MSSEVTEKTDGNHGEKLNIALPAVVQHSLSHEEHRLMRPPSPFATRRTRTNSLVERSMMAPDMHGKIKYFCRQNGHGFITPAKEECDEDLFVHISDIEGEFVPHEGDAVVYKICAVPPKFEKYQAVHVRIKNLAPGRHERWDEPPPAHSHPHPSPNIHQEHECASHLTSNAKKSPSPGV